MQMYGSCEGFPPNSARSLASCHVMTPVGSTVWNLPGYVAPQTCDEMGGILGMQTCVFPKRKEILSDCRS